MPDETYTEILARSGNAKNRFQGLAKRVLCVCSAGLLRSPTIAWVLSNPPYLFNTRAAGIIDEYALIKVDGVLIDWASEIVCASSDVLRELSRRFGEATAGKDVLVLDIPDNFERMDPQLINIIEQRYKKLNRVHTA